MLNEKMLSTEQLRSSNICLLIKVLNTTLRYVLVPVDADLLTSLIIITYLYLKK